MFYQNIHNSFNIVSNKIFHSISMSHQFFNRSNICRSNMKIIILRFNFRSISRAFLIYTFKININKVHIKLIRGLANDVHMTTRVERFRFFFIGFCSIIWMSFIKFRRYIRVDPSTPNFIKMNLHSSNPRLHLYEKYLWDIGRTNPNFIIFMGNYSNDMR